MRCLYSRRSICARSVAYITCLERSLLECQLEREIFLDTYIFAHRYAMNSMLGDVYSVMQNIAMLRSWIINNGRQMFVECGLVACDPVIFTESLMEIQSMFSNCCGAEKYNWFLSMKQYIFDNFYRRKKNKYTIRQSYLGTHITLLLSCKE